MRLHYVAFSRAEKLLVLTTTETPKPHFNPIWQGLPQWPYVQKELLAAQHFAPKVRVPIKQTFSFTSHVKVYETCPRQYQFFQRIRVRALPLRGDLLRLAGASDHRGHPPLDPGGAAGGRRGAAHPADVPGQLRRAGQRRVPSPQRRPARSGLSAGDEPTSTRTRIACSGSSPPKWTCRGRRIATS